MNMVDKTVLDNYKSKLVINLVELLKSIPACISLLGQLYLISFTVPDVEFSPDLTDIKEIYLYSGWFHAGLQQVVTAGSDVLCFAAEKLHEIEPLMIYISCTILQDFRSDKKEPNKIITCIDVVQRVAKRFEGMRNLIQELQGAITASCAELEVKSDFKAEIDEKFKGLMKGLLILSNLGQQWQQFIEFFNFLVEIFNDEINVLVDEFKKGITQTSDRKQARIKTAFDNQQAAIGATVNLVTNLYKSVLQTYGVDCLETLDKLLTINDRRKQATQEKELAEKCESLIIAMEEKHIAAAKNDFILESKRYSIAKAAIAIDKTVLEEYRTKHVPDLVRLLAAAPEVIVLLGRLCLISSSAPDVELPLPQDVVRNGKFKHFASVWFRACLHQVVNGMNTSFGIANKNLGEMEVHARLIPKGVLDITNLTLKGKPEEIVAHLPKLLDDVANKAYLCYGLAKAVEDRFELMVLLITELNEAITVSQSRIEDKEGGKEALVRINGLMEGLKTLSQIKQQYGKLVEFFNFLVSTIENELNGPLGEFLASIMRTVNRKFREGKISDFVQKKLQQEANKLATIGGQVNLVTNLYLGVSQTHLVERLVTLDSMLTITDGKEKEEKEQELKVKCAASVASIEKLKEECTATADKDFKKLLQIR